jgi:TatA/E family protein of Tat protein translocase
VFALIFETLSTTELLFILVIALIFFGPRKLPQLARSMGKGLAEFRKASDDFKRTWEREVAMEASKLETELESTVNYEDHTQAYLPENGSSVSVAVSEGVSESLMPESVVQAPEPELAVARGSVANGPDAVLQPEPLSQTDESLTPAAEPAAPEPFRKQDWL